MRYSNKLKFSSFIVILSAFSFFTSNVSRAEIKNLGQVTPFIFRGALPSEYQDYEMLANRGITTILSLLTTSSDIKKEKMIAEQLGFTFISVPISGLLSPSKEDMNKIQNALINSTSKPIFVHCRYGQDRTGLSIGIYRVRQEQWSKEKAYEEMKVWGFKPILVGLSHYFWEHTYEDVNNTIDLTSLINL